MSKIDYQYVHDKTCELIEYLESCGFSALPQHVYEINNMLQNIAFNEANRKGKE